MGRVKSREFRKPSSIACFSRSPRTSQAPIPMFWEPISCFVLEQELCASLAPATAATASILTPKHWVP